MDTTQPKSSAPDWRVIEREYRAGIKSVRQIAGEHGITHGAINKRAKRDDWSRDLSAKIQAKADALISKAVSAKESASKRASEQSVVESNAAVQVDVRLRHRSDARRLGLTVARISQTLDGEDGKALPLLTQAKTAKSLVDAFGSLVAIEREAFGIKADAPADAGGLATLATTELQRLLSKLAEEAAQ